MEQSYEGFQWLMVCPKVSLPKMFDVCLCLGMDHLIFRGLGFFEKNSLFPYSSEKIKCLQ